MFRNTFKISQLNQNFSPIRRVIDEDGIALILKHGSPKYLIISLEQLSKDDQNKICEIIQSLHPEGIPFPG